MPSYQTLLRAAQALGREDGRFAAEFEPFDSAGSSSTCCRGLDPAEFARWLSNANGAAPVAGLELNAPRWYAHGFQEGLADARGCRPAAADRSGAPPLLDAG